MKNKALTENIISTQARKIPIFSNINQIKNSIKTVNQKRFTVFLYSKLEREETRK